MITSTRTLYLNGQYRNEFCFFWKILNVLMFITFLYTSAEREDDFHAGHEE